MTDTDEHQLIQVGCYASTSIVKSKRWEVEMEHTNNNDSPESVAIEVSHLTQGYGKTIVLQDIDFTVHKGEILALIGPSGSGKTTLISTIMGMMPAKTGSVRVLGVPMPNRTELGNIGFMAQNDALYTNLSGLENLKFFASLQQVNKHQFADYAMQAARIVHLENSLKRRVANYSGGMKRRLSMAIALISNPPVLILDEPTVGIDPELRREVWSELHRIAEQGRTIILTTHVMADAAEADTLLMIRQGEVIAKGSPDTVKQHYQVTSIEDAFVRAGKEQDAHLSND
ncbi:MAG: ABC transporter ATP-binding protein [Bifidobacterium sp.]|jgi:ABC-2 type transport system ATP-binding protein|nr:ABC transporter ATP-binding protein [Bifidobacterium sp.]MCH4175501.1 ABC transporter ATP-binding protein [Bifidobacterium sp.]